MPRSPIERARAAVVAMFFVSGISGLVYQIVWVRQFARIFGNTIHSAALVTGVFMGGLGVGSVVVGRWSDRRFRADPAHPLRAYGWAEIAVGALGLAFALVLPRATAISAAFSAYERGAHGFFELSAGSHAVRYVVAVLAVAPATFLMGGTLTLLIRFVVARDLAAVGARVGLLYGANTAGAAIGAILTDLVLIERLGIFSTQLVAVSLNAVAGLAALTLARSSGAVDATNEIAPAAPAAGDDARARRVVALTGASIFLSGFAAMGLEILWFRHLSEILGSLRAVFSLLLAVILVGIWIGAVAGGRLQQRLGRPVALFVGAEALLALTTAALLGLVDHAGIAARHAAAVRDAFVAAPPGERVLLELWSNVRSVGIVALLPALFMGATFPLANAAAQRAEESVAGRAGLLYLANTAGNVLGSALVGFAILPALGAQRTALVLLVSVAASVVPIALTARDGATRRAKIAFAGCLGALSTAIAAFAQLPPGTLLRAAFPRGDQSPAHRILSVSEGLNETIVIAEVPGYMTRLYTNGHSMSGDGPKAQRYMRAFSHLPLLSIEGPERVLVICFGTGNTLHAASLHPSVKRLDVADLSRHVLEHAPFFAASNGGILDDPRVSVFVNDGRLHLSMQPPGAYDVITLEPPPIAFAGVSALYSREFYELARSRLAPGGQISQWLPGYQLGGDAVLSMVRAFVDVFPASVLVSGDDDELILWGSNDSSITLDPAAIERRLRDRPRVREDLDRIEMGSLTEIAGSFAASRATLAHATAGVAPLTDDRPAIEYVRRSRLGVLGAAWMPRELFDTSGVDAWCPSCASTLPDLGAYLRVRGRIYASDWFRSHKQPGTVPPAGADIEDALARSAYLRRLFGGEAYAARRVAAAHLARGDVDLAIGTLRYAVINARRDPAVHEELAAAHAAAGDFEAAAEELSRSLGLDAGRASAHVAFAQALARLGKPEIAAREYELAIQIDPGDAGAHYGLGAVLSTLGKKAESEAELATALDLDPLEPRASFILCKRAAARGDLAAAIDRCDVAAMLGVIIPADLADKLAAHR